jgi:chaperonin GroEL
MPKSQRQWQSPGVKFRPAVQRGFQRGVDQLVHAIRPTLGPYSRNVVNQPRLQGQRPEFLDNGAFIARRIIMLPDRIEDVGAMYLREMLWNVYETAGDGTATAAVLFHSIYEQGLCYLAAGGNAMLLRRHLEQAAQVLLDALEGMRLPLNGRQQLAGFANSLCHDVDLAEVLAEALDLLGADGRLEIRAGRSRKLVLELFDGLYWDGGLLNHTLAGYASSKIALTDPAFLVTDLEIKEPEELLPLLDIACGAGIRGLVLLATRISDKALSLLGLPANRQRIQVVPVKAPSDSVSLRENLEDIAILVGGRPLLAATGDKLEAIRLENLGRARRAWADKEYLGLEAGQGDPRQLRQHIAELRKAMDRAEEAEARQRLQKRISRLIYGSAVLWVGATTPVALEARKELAKRTTEATRGALVEGVVPGGGVALLNLKPVLHEKVRQAQDIDEIVAHKILLKAVEAPIRALLDNAGHRPETILAEIAHCPAGHGFDVRRGEVSDMAQAGILDATAVVKIALCNAIHSAALALTIDVLIQRANPPIGLKPQ